MTRDPMTQGSQDPRIPDLRTGLDVDLAQDGLALPARPRG